MTDAINELGALALCYLALMEVLKFFTNRRKSAIVCPLINHKDWDELLNKTRDIHNTNTELVKVLEKLATASEAQTVAMVKISERVRP